MSNGYIGKLPAIGVYYADFIDEVSELDLKTDDNIIFVGERSKRLLEKFIRENSIDADDIDVL